MIFEKKVKIAEAGFRKSKSKKSEEKKDERRKIGRASCRERV